MSGLLSLYMFGTSSDALEAITLLDMSEEKTGVGRLRPFLLQPGEDWQEFCETLRSCANLTTLTLADIPWNGRFFMSNCRKTEINSFFNTFREALRHCSKLATLHISNQQTENADINILRAFKGAFDSIQTVYFSANEVTAMSRKQISAWAEIFPNVSQCVMTCKNQAGQLCISEETSPNIKKLQFKIGQLFKQRAIESACIIYQASQGFVIENTSKQMSLPIALIRFIGEYLPPFIANGVEALCNPSKKFLWHVSQAIPRQNASAWSSFAYWLFPTSPSILLSVLTIAQHKDQASINYPEIAGMLALLALITVPESTQVTPANRIKLIDSGYSIFEKKLKTYGPKSENKKELLVSFLSAQQVSVEKVFQNQRV